MESKARIEKARIKEQATFNYIHASTIVKGVSVVLGASKDGFPTLEETYSSLFTDEKEIKRQRKQELKNELSIARFKQFADFHNKKYK